MYSRRREYTGDSYIANKYVMGEVYNGFRLMDVQPGHHLRDEGAPEFELFVMLEGLAYSSFYDYQKKIKVNGIFLPSSLLGGGFISDTQIAIDTVTVLDPSVVLAINRNVIPDLYQDPQAVAEIAQASAHDAYCQRRLGIAVNQPLNVDRVGQLMYLLTQNGELESPRIAHDKFARLLNMGRSRFSIAISELTDQGYLRVQRKNPNSYAITTLGKNQYRSDIAY